ncbi:tetratricopeptide repeat protein [Aliikangiella marina]|uniref:Tetratricopeptide repeat protein n=1 Tax=Aliikangiella marina TaxID=1712262 RepID=A0A545TBY1_9GAMM|nr:tetratricopeptide repeat protein [Aliikangiella marina]TQV74728.1 tetratricopeptide repeat protein [Aliikangiella marina]
MKQEQSLIKTLLQRRVPQILGLYIAATWMMIEIGDWMVDRFNLMPEITSYIFIGMVFFVPSVCYLAYQYGQPGRDPWKKPTFFVVPTNLIIAIGAMFYFVNPVVATETKLVVDETGVQRTFEVAKQGYRKQVVGFFWRNQSQSSEEDWLQYGLPWLLNKDLNRSLFISGYTPFDDYQLFADFKAAGFTNGLRIPKSLQLKIARDNFDQYVLNGFYKVNAGIYELTLEIYQAKSGEKIATHSVKGDNYLLLIDELTNAVKDTFEVPDTLEDRTSDLPVAEHISESLEAIQKRVESNVKIFVENNYPAAKKLLEEAVALDFSFADAYARLAQVNQMMGSGIEAARALSEAMKHEYKFTPQDQFRYKAMAYGLRGEYGNQIKVFDMWIEIEPENVEAREASANLLLITGLDPEKALLHLLKLRELKPQDYSILKNLANLFLLSNRLDKAIESLLEYDRLQPNDTGALNQLAEIYQRDGKFAEANAIIDKVLLLERNNGTAALLRAKVDFKLGNFQAAEDYLNRLLVESPSSPEKFVILGGLLRHHSYLGQMERALELVEEMKLHMSHLPPLLQIFRVKFPKSFYLANIGRFDEGLVELAQVKSQLQPPVDGIIDVGYLNLYVIKEDTQKVEEYLQIIQAYLEEYPNPLFNSILESSKGELAELNQNYQLAQELHERALKFVLGNVVNSQDEDAVLMQKVKLARVQVKTGQTSQAYELLEEVIVQHPSFPQAHVTLAEYHLSVGEIDKAEQALQKVAVIWGNADREYRDFKHYLQVKERLVSRQQ